MKKKKKKSYKKFSDIETEKEKFHQHKRLISIKCLGINKIVV